MELQGSGRRCSATDGRGKDRPRRRCLPVPPPPSQGLMGQPPFPLNPWSCKHRRDAIKDGRAGARQWVLDPMLHTEQQWQQWRASCAARHCCPQGQSCRLPPSRGEARSHAWAAAFLGTHFAWTLAPAQLHTAHPLMQRPSGARLAFRRRHPLLPNAVAEQPPALIPAIGLQLRLVDAAPFTRNWPGCALASLLGCCTSGHSSAETWLLVQGSLHESARSVGSLAASFGKPSPASSPHCMGMGRCSSTCGVSQTSHPHTLCCWPSSTQPRRAHTCSWGASAPWRQPPGPAAFSKAQSAAAACSWPEGRGRGLPAPCPEAGAPAGWAGAAAPAPIATRSAM